MPASLWGLVYNYFAFLWQQDTVKFSLQALGLYNLVRGFRWAYKRRGYIRKVGKGGGGYKLNKTRFEASHGIADRNTFLVEKS